MSIIGFIRRLRAMGVDEETALTMGEAFEAECPEPVPLTVMDGPELMTAAVKGERFALVRKDRGPDPQWIITDAVGDLYAYLDEKAAIADFSAMFARPARRAA